MRNRSAWILSALMSSAPALAQPGPDVAPPNPAPKPDGAEPPAEAGYPAAEPNPVLVVPPAEPRPEPPKPAPEAMPPPPSPIMQAATPSPFAKTERDEGATPEPEALGEPRDFGLEFALALNDRLSSPSSYADERGVGAAYGVGLWFTLASRAAAGFELAYADLGRASAAAGQSLVNTEFSSTGLWLGGRFFPWQSQSVRLFLALKVGLALQHVAAAGVRQEGSALTAATPFDCRASSGPHFGLGAGLGAVFRITSRIAFIPRLDFRDERLTSDDVGGCASGLGSTGSLSMGLGVAYGFDGPSGANAGLAAQPPPAQTW